MCVSFSIGNFQVPGRRLFFFPGVCVVFVLRCTVMLLEVVLLYDLMLLVLLCLSAEVNCLACLMFIRRIMRIMITGNCMATTMPSTKGAAVAK